MFLNFPWIFCFCPLDLCKSIRVQNTLLIHNIFQILICSKFSNNACISNPHKGLLTTYKRFIRYLFEEVWNPNSTHFNDVNKERSLFAFIYSCSVGFKLFPVCFLNKTFSESASVYMCSVNVSWNFIFSMLFIVRVYLYF